MVIDEPVASHSNSAEEIQKCTTCANRIHQMANIQHVFYCSAKNDRSGKPSAVKTWCKCWSYCSLLCKNLNKFKIPSPSCEGALIKRIRKKASQIRNAIINSSVYTTVMYIDFNVKRQILRLLRFQLLLVIKIVENINLLRCV